MFDGGQPRAECRVDRSEKLLPRSDVHDIVRELRLASPRSRCAKSGMSAASQLAYCAEYKLDLEDRPDMSPPLSEMAGGCTSKTFLVMALSMVRTLPATNSSVISLGK